MTPASQPGRPRSVCVIESRACHVTSHRVFLWGHTAFDTLLSLFTLDDSISWVNASGRPRAGHVNFGKYCNLIGISQF